MAIFKTDSIELRTRCYDSTAPIKNVAEVYVFTDLVDDASSKKDCFAVIEVGAEAGNCFAITFRGASEIRQLIAFLNGALNEEERDV